MWGSKICITSQKSHIFNIKKICTKNILKLQNSPVSDRSTDGRESVGYGIAEQLAFVVASGKNY
jgi:hypothetical protein